MATLRRHCLALALCCLAPHASACRPAYMEHYPRFEHGASRLTSAEVVRLAEWRILTRKAFPAGFTVFMALRRNDEAGVPAPVAQARAENLVSLMQSMDVPTADISTPEIRSTSKGHVKPEDEDRFMNEAAIVINPRCPHACCPR